ncbi:hypothetical protein ACTXLQ_12130 [Enterococcus hirae]|uniref:hypothetical protein n=1 Tax=Enterococcus TaxID=1350 RepID=UPI0019FC6B8D|nr:hypothetical protein [Enterococcus hirae]EMF0287471.1 hypothetical protein [Enterococcus hirae]EMF0390460.1 hypothetical protein [Enterococcus hirae]EMF0393560.1 hypothetical protein [Enterococcus hirae]
MKTKKKLLLFVILILIAGLYSVNYFRHAQTISTTGDIAFHLSRIKGLSSIFSGPINFTTFNSYGSGVNYFYPYLTLFPTVIFYWITNNLIVSYILYVWVLNVCTILLMFYYGQKFLKRVDAAFLFSCLYTFYSYRTIDIYHRSAIAEAIALTIMPVVLYYAYKMIYEKATAAIPLAISMSLLVYTHVLSTFMCAFFIGMMIIGKLIVNKLNKEETIRLVLEMSKAVGMTILLTAYFWYPMFKQTMYQSINQPGKTDLQNQAINVSDSLIGAMNNDLASFTIGIIGIVSLILPLVYFKKLTSKEKVIYLIAVATWLLSTKLIPWALLQNTPVRLLQFPWRILGFQVLFGSLILSIVFNRMVFGQKKRILGIAAIVCFMFVVSAATKANYNHKVPTLGDHLEVNKDTLGSYITVGVGGVFDYAPLEAMKYKEHVQKHEIRVDNEWQTAAYKASDSKIVYTVKGAKDKKITLPVFDYWGTTAKVNGQNTKIENNEGLATFEGKAGTTVIEVSSKYPFTMILAFIVSLGSYLFVFIRFLIGKCFVSKKIA